MASLIEKIANEYAAECAKHYKDPNPRRGGALVGAEGKSARRELVFKRLAEATKKRGWDMTQTHAYQSAKRILGRGVSFDHARQWFATKERSAADKSSLDIAEMKDVESSIRKEVALLDDKMETIREALKTRK